MEVDSSSSLSSEEEGEFGTDRSTYIHSASIKLSVGNEETAKTVADIIKVDKEPSRSGARRQVSFNGEFVVVKVESKDHKSLSKTIANAFEMIEVAIRMIKVCEKYKTPSENELKRELPDESQD